MRDCRFFDAAALMDSGGIEPPTPGFSGDRPSTAEREFSLPHFPVLARLYPPNCPLQSIAENGGNLRYEEWSRRKRVVYSFANATLVASVIAMDDGRPFEAHERKDNHLSNFATLEIYRRNRHT
jgi:hypothetical protein